VQEGKKESVFAVYLYGKRVEMFPGLVFRLARKSAQAKADNKYNMKPKSFHTCLFRLQRYNICANYKKVLSLHVILMEDFTSRNE